VQKRRIVKLFTVKDRIDTAITVQVYIHLRMHLEPNNSQEYLLCRHLLGVKYEPDKNV